MSVRPLSAGGLWHAIRNEQSREIAMDINPRLYVEIYPFDGPHPPHPHPIDEGHFDPDYVYKVLGMYNPSETSECYFVLSNTQRQIWFIPQRHLLAYRLIDSDEFFLPKTKSAAVDRNSVNRFASKS
jgi:hypothetical protein